MGFPIWSETKDLCERTQCPVKKGPVELAVQEYLPPLTPPVSLSILWKGLSFAADGLDLHLHTTSLFKITERISTFLALVAYNQVLLASLPIKIQVQKAQLPPCSPAGCLQHHYHSSDHCKRPASVLTSGLSDPATCPAYNNILKPG